jgi:hypothetical protein
VPTDQLRELAMYLAVYDIVANSLPESQGLD